MINNINYSTNNEGDDLIQLPIDNTTPTHNELIIIDSLFKEKKNLFDKILEKCKDLIILVIFFIIFSLPQADTLIKKFIFVTNNSFYILIGVKALLFSLFYFIIKNIYLVRK